ncbi:MAG: hypothetical protein K0R24_1515 [Gammaproteobacteria bacterium]|jgi:hypothetical protein|nr:hypothetical protein [Gammaproteobacteria bacterium]
MPKPSFLEKVNKHLEQKRSKRIVGRFLAKYKKNPKSPDLKKNQHFKEIIKKLADPGTYEPMKEAIYSRKNEKFQDFVEDYFRDALDIIMRAAEIQKGHFLEKYEEAIEKYEEAIKKHENQNPPFDPPHIIRKKIELGKHTEININNYPKDMQPLIEQMQALSRTMYELRIERQLGEKTILDHYRNRLIAVHESLTKATNEKKYTDLEIITKDPNPSTAAFNFKEKYYAAANAVSMITFPLPSMREKNSIISSRYSFFRKPSSHDLKKPVEDVEKDLGFKRKSP